MSDHHSSSCPWPLVAPAHHLHPGHRAEERHHLCGQLLGSHGHAETAGPPAGVVAPAVGSETAGPEAHVGVVGGAHQRRARGQAERPVAVPDDRRHLHPLAVARDGLLAGPEPLDVARAQTAQRPVPDLATCQRAPQLVAEELELGQVMLGATQAVACRMPACSGQPDRAGAGPSNGQRHGGGALAAHSHRGDLQSGVVDSGQQAAQAVEPGRGVGPARGPRRRPLEGLVHPEPHVPLGGERHRPGSAGPQIDTDHDRIHHHSALRPSSGRSSRTLSPP